jgi:hypothetical protein
MAVAKVNRAFLLNILSTPILIDLIFKDKTEK